MFGEVNISDGVKELVKAQGIWESYWGVVNQLGGFVQEREMIAVLIPIRFDNVLILDHRYQLVLKPAPQPVGSMTRWFHETNCRCVDARPHEVLDETGTGLHVDNIKAVFELTATRSAMAITPSVKQVFNWKEEGF